MSLVNIIKMNCFISVVLATLSSELQFYIRDYYVILPLPTISHVWKETYSGK